MQQIIRLETERLILQSVQLSDCTPAYLSWLNDAEVTGFTDAAYSSHTMEQLENFVKYQLARHDSVFLSIRLKENDQHIGNIKIDAMHRYHKTGEYGIMMGERPAWGKGYAKEASVAIINYCFDQLGLRKISLTVADGHTAAFQLYKKLGFQVEGILRESFYHLPTQKFMNGIRMGLLKQEWKFGTSSYT